MKLRGVNLGGWLVLERWITPSLFEGTSAQDETSLSLELGSSKESTLQEHRDRFITQNDFRWIDRAGLNSVRLPIPHWIFGDIEPYVGVIDKLDWAIETAGKHNLQVVIDLHTAPGSQNGWDHSGLVGDINWHKNDENIETTLSVLSRIAKRYAGVSNLAGIELLNEPHWEIPRDKLVDFYRSAYKLIRAVSNVPIIISDAFRPAEWQEELVPPNYEDVWLDMHLYQCFDEKDKKLDVSGHLDKTNKDTRSLIDRISTNRPAVIGEWSLDMGGKALEGLSEEAKILAIRDYASAQLEQYSRAHGWFFWTYKTENMPLWNFRHCVEKGLLPLDI